MANHKPMGGLQPKNIATCEKGSCERVKKGAKKASFNHDGHVICQCEEISPHFDTFAEQKEWFKSHQRMGTLSGLVGGADDDEQEDQRSAFTGARFGTAGQSLTSSGAREEFGSESARAGMVGEKYLDHAFKRNDKLSEYTLYRSLKIPAGPRQKRYRSDVDFAFVSGNNVVLVDCKSWSAGHFYWSFFGKLMKDFRPMGDKDQMSRNMAMAVSRYEEALPNHRVTGIVVFSPTKSRKNGGVPTGVFLLRWPGNIRSYLPNDGMRKIARLLGSPEPPTSKAAILMGKMTR